MKEYLTSCEVKLKPLFKQNNNIIKDIFFRNSDVTELSFVIVQANRKRQKLRLKDELFSSKQQGGSYIVRKILINAKINLQFILFNRLHS
jgi:uncharacterized protein YdcH (DUF465 family)